MLENANVLIVEDESLIAEEIGQGIEAAGGVVIGPVPTVAEALSLIDRIAVDAAILDANLADRDVTPVALRLVARDVPTIVYSGIGLPEDLAAIHPHLPLILKPAPVALLVARLSEMVDLRLRLEPTYWGVVIDSEGGHERRVHFEMVSIMAVGGASMGRSAYLGQELIGILVPVSADEQGDGEGHFDGWYLEAGFGPCSQIAIATPPVFADLSDAGHWIEATVLEDQRRRSLH